MQKSAELFKRSLQDIQFETPKGTLISTVTGHKVTGDMDWKIYLYNQIIYPVLFQQALKTAAKDIDLFIEVGPGNILANFAEQVTAKPAMAIDVGNETLVPFLSAVGAAFVAGRAPGVKALFDDRYYKQFQWGVKLRHLSNQCELNDLDYSFENASIQSQSNHVDKTKSAADRNILESLRTAIAAEIGLPEWTIQNNSRMLSDLHLNSITVSKIVAEALSSSGLPALIDPTQFSNSSIDEISAALLKLLELKDQDNSHQQVIIHGVHPWVRYFAIHYQPAPPQVSVQSVERGTWRVVCSSTNRNSDLCKSIAANASGSGILLVLDDPLETKYSDLLLEAAQQCLEQREFESPPELVVIQHASIAGGFLKSYSLENPQLKIVLFTIQENLNDKVANSISERLGTTSSGFMEFRVGETDGLEIPLLSQIPKLNGQHDFPVDENDLVLVTGGGKGISAECAYHLALNTGCALLIIGRSDLMSDDEVARNIKRLNHANLRTTYFRADVTDRSAVESAIANALANWDMSHVAGIIHGAGINRPNLVERLSPTDIHDTMLPKIDGFKNLVTCVDPHKLKFLATFSSIIGRIGLHGEADYALANERLSLETEVFQKKYPHVLCRALEWSIWSGTGMGHSMGRIDVLMEQGIAPITIDDGIAEFLHLISCRDYPTSLIITSRFARSDAIRLPRSRQTRFRFIDTVEIDYPGIELVAQ
ncbi:MAG: SDR family NAD(P)-dependent oxidoreductase, partial [Candidatus Electrothrix sp. ATG2]|nr:SDR family NAD(P)-dependent oxidoreductase [Candidatus Electrothrix sp. ATG2]